GGERPARATATDETAGQWGWEISSSRSTAALLPMGATCQNVPKNPAAPRFPMGITLSRIQGRSTLEEVRESPQRFGRDRVCPVEFDVPRLLRGLREHFRERKRFLDQGHDVAQADHEH